MSSFVLHNPLKSSFILHNPIVSSFILHNPLMSSFILHNPLMSSFVLHNPLKSSFILHNPIVSSFILHNPLMSSFILHNPLMSSFILHNPLMSSFILHNPLMSSLILHNPLVSSFILHNPLVSSFLIQSNRLMKIEGLDTLTELDELYISHNGIECIEGLDGCVSWSCSLSKNHSSVTKSDFCISSYSLNTTWKWIFMTKRDIRHFWKAEIKDENCWFFSSSSVQFCNLWIPLVFTFLTWAIKQKLSAVGIIEIYCLNL